MLFGKTKTERLRDWMFDSDPYAEFDRASAPADPQGWGSDKPIFRTAIEAVRPKTIIELGTWKGMSAIHMAKICEELGLETEIVCVDTWLGSPENWLEREDVNGFASMRLHAGFPRLYDTFVANVLDAGVERYITPFANTTDNAAVVFKKLGFACDLLYVDAAHETEPVLKDLRAFTPLVRKGGWVVGDDWKWGSVRKAAETFAKERRVQLEHEANKYWFRV